jgi:[ribosomal protein S5]-alanine N-acetyltransferase
MSTDSPPPNHPHDHPQLFPKLETPRLILRQAYLSDAKTIFEILSDAEVTKYHDLSPPTSLSQVEWLINQRAKRFQAKQGIRWGIAHKSNNVVIGSCGYRYKSPTLAEVGYELAQPYWRQGIMSEALNAIIQFGFQTIGLQRIEAMVMLENTASSELLKKLGFIEEGILRDYGFWKGQFHDLRLFSLLKQDS